MSALFLALLAGLLGAAGGRDQRVLAGLRTAFGPAVPLLAAACAASLASAALAAWAGALLARELSTDGGRMFAAIALAFAAIELALPVRVRPVREPTRSAGAVFLVLFAAQIGDAPRFLMVALAAKIPVPALVALGGALGACGALALVWSEPSLVERHGAIRVLRWSLAAIAGLAAVLTGLAARGITA